MSDSSAKFKNYSVASLCIIACIFLISILYILNNGIKQYKEQLVLQSEIQGELIQKVSTAYDDYKLYFADDAHFKISTSYLLGNNLKAFLKLIN